MRGKVWALLALLGMPFLAGCVEGPSLPLSGGTGDIRWRFTDTEGNVWTNASVEGAPALLFVMATWCSTCRAKAPDVADLHGEFGDRVRFFSVGLDVTEGDADLEAWKAARGQPWPHGIDNRDAGLSVARAYGVTVQSWIVVLDGTGGVVMSTYNPSAPDVRGALERALAA